LNRAEAVDLIKELITLGLVLPSFVTIDENQEGKFGLTIKADSDMTEVRAFLACKNLMLYENKETGFCSIFKP
jgi:hypothetical protein